MIQYPKTLVQIDEDTKLVLLAEAFGIPHTTKTVTEGDCEWGGVGTWYDVDYIEFDTTEEDLGILLEAGIRSARKTVSVMMLDKEIHG